MIKKAHMVARASMLCSYYYIQYIETVEFRETVLKLHHDLLAENVALWSDCLDAKTDLELIIRICPKIIFRVGRHK